MLPYVPLVQSAVTVAELHALQADYQLSDNYGDFKNNKSYRYYLKFICGR